MTTAQVGGMTGRLRRALALCGARDQSDARLLDRYLTRRDEAAFEILWQRHGPMVLGVCRRVLRREQDAEDAFQATFLIFLRRAQTIVPRCQVGNWLHGVAYRTALALRTATSRRRAKERVVAAASQPAVGLWDDLLPLLDRELNRLPEKYRAPLVLCDLEGKTRREASLLLGWPMGR